MLTIKISISLLVRGMEEETEIRNRGFKDSAIWETLY